MAATDLVTLADAKAALDITGTTHDDRLTGWITAASETVDALCGPVVQRAVTVYLDGGGTSKWLPTVPAASITTVTEWSGGTSDVLTVSTGGDTSTADVVVRGLGTRICRLDRTSGGNADVWAAGTANIEVVYQAGRYANTAAVAERFQLACTALLRRLWDREAGAWARGGATDPFDPAAGSRFFRTTRVVEELLPDELLTGTVLG